MGGGFWQDKQASDGTEAKSLVACWEANTMRVTDGERVAQVSPARQDEFLGAAMGSRHNMGLVTPQGQFGAAARATT